MIPSKPSKGSSMYQKWPPASVADSVPPLGKEISPFAFISPSAQPPINKNKQKRLNGLNMIKDKKNLLFFPKLMAQEMVLKFKKCLFVQKGSNDYKYIRSLPFSRMSEEVISEALTS